MISQGCGSRSCPEVARVAVELMRVDQLLDDPAFFAPFVAFFDPQRGSAVDADGVLPICG
jgi:IS5 family transposase